MHICLSFIDAAIGNSDICFIANSRVEAHNKNGLQVRPNDSKKDSSFKPDAVLENHFHLGHSNYAIVSDFADAARIHWRHYKLGAKGSLFPTKSGITLIPSVWLALVREFAATDQAF
ncbi:PC4 domain-containing protein [Nephila pilipes]|uniref:PC4 domain-containing protein n=1 Tax=Nephila pilipes TaxID=299642 RepID=A0A8X6NGY8_NEPPI|nr:PC4 domain-containing protein [Nephila pilipes]